MVKELSLLYILLSPLPSFGQEKIGYAYDAAGNRVKREIVLPVRQTKGKQQGAKPVVHDLSNRLTGHTVAVNPDPSGGSVTVRLSNLSASGQGAIKVYTTQGAEVFSSWPTACNGYAEVRIDLSRQPAGVYLLKITIGDNTSTWKVTRK